MSWTDAAAAALLALAFRSAGLECGVLALVGAVLGGPALAVAGLVAGVGAHQALSYQGFRRREEAARLDGEATLMRIRQRVRAGQPVTAAIEDALGGRGASEVDGVLGLLVSRMPRTLRASAGALWRAALARGGRVDRLVEMLLVQIRTERALSDQLEAALAGPRGTAVLLAAAPWVAVVGLRLMVPTFFQILTDTLPGVLAVIAVAGVQSVVFCLLWPAGGVR
ncbi:MAG: type II secretion system F family protein [Clostridia bacterium]